MIQNTSVLRRKDVLVSLRRQNSSARNKKVDILLIITGVLLVVTRTILLLLAAVQGTMDSSHVLHLVISLLLLAAVLVSALAGDRLSAAFLMLAPETRTPLHFTDTETGIRLQAELRGSPVTRDIPFTDMTGFQALEDAVYIFLKPVSGREAFFCLRDDSYTEGSRDALTALLTENGVQRV